MPKSYQDLKDKSVLITGGATGIGFAIAGAFAGEGANVVIVGRDKAKLARAADQLGGRVHDLSFDLTDIPHLPALLEQAREKVGNLDVLVNNAGVNLKREALSVSDREFEEVVRTNQTSVFALTREVARGMVARKSGNIIMISSMASHYGIPNVVAYTAAKSAVEGMTRALAVEWSGSGVRINCIAPGFIATAMSSKALDNDPERKRRVIARTPLGTLGDPEDVANAALFLASDQAKFVTGIVLPVDGGNSIGF